MTDHFRSDTCLLRSEMTGVTKNVACTVLSGMVHTIEPLLLIRKSSPCSGGSRFPLSLSE